MRIEAILPTATLLAASLLWSPVALAGPGAGKAKSYPDAVRQARVAAEAVLARSGTQSCLRGKLNRALLRLSASCAAAGEDNSLCSLADKAVVVTPMNLAFMDATSRSLLELTAPEQASTR
jgi:hypothetical protein